MAMKGLCFNKCFNILRFGIGDRKGRRSLLLHGASFLTQLWVATARQGRMPTGTGKGATYLARMEGEEDNGWDGVAAALGVS